MPCSMRLSTDGTNYNEAPSTGPFPDILLTESRPSGEQGYGRTQPDVIAGTKVSRVVGAYEPGRSKARGDSHSLR